jgi:hypothetical protein
LVGSFTAPVYGLGIFKLIRRVSKKCGKLCNIVTATSLLN